MAISALAKWELRATATANNVNGGFFVTGASGVNYSEQNAAQYALTGVTSAGAGNTVLTASAATDMVGNGIKVVSGTNFTVSWFEITSVVAGVSITCSTNAAGTAISTGVGATGVMNVGGAISLNTSGASGDDDVFEAGTAGNTYWIKNGSFTLGETVSISLIGTAAAEIQALGYNATRGDNPTGNNRPTITCAALAFSGNQFWKFENLIFTGTAAVLFTPGAGRSRNIKSTNNSTTTTRVAYLLSSNSINDMIEAVSLRGSAMSGTGSSVGTIRYGYLHDSSVGLRLAGIPQYTVIGNIIADNYTTCIAATSTNITQSVFLQNTLYGAENKLGVGLDMATGITIWSSENNIFYGFTTAVNMTDAANPFFDDYNNYFNNTTDVVNITKGPNDIATNPSFTSMTQITGTGATSSTNVLTDGTKNFTALGVTTSNFIYLVSGSGTGFAVGKYAISAVGTTTLTLSDSGGGLITSSGAGSNIVYQITLGNNFLPTATITGFPGTFQGGLTVGYASTGAVQRQAGGGGSTGGSYTFG